MIHPIFILYVSELGAFKAYYSEVGKMKKLVILIGLFIFAAGLLAADEYVIGQISYYEPDYGNPESINFKYEDTDKIFYLQTSDWYTTGWVEISNDQLISLRKTLQKCLDWAKIAEESGTEVKKELPDSTIISSVTWKSGDEWHKNATWDKINIHTHFIAIENEHPMVLILANKIQSNDNKYLKYEFPTMIMPMDNIRDFIQVISEDNIQDVIAKHENSKKAEDLFN